jgi:hypothetical protein
LQTAQTLMGKGISDSIIIKSWLGSSGGGTPWGVGMAKSPVYSDLRFKQAAK